MLPSKYNKILIYYSTFADPNNKYMIQPMLFHVESAALSIHCFLAFSICKATEGLFQGLYHSK